MERWSILSFRKPGDPVIIPAVFAIATGLPVIIISYLLVAGVGNAVEMLRKWGRSNPGSGERLQSYISCSGCTSLPSSLEFVFSRNERDTERDLHGFPVITDGIVFHGIRCNCQVVRRPGVATGKITCTLHSARLSRTVPPSPAPRFP